MTKKRLGADAKKLIQSADLMIICKKNDYYNAINKVYGGEQRTIEVGHYIALMVLKTATLSVNHSDLSLWQFDDTTNAIRSIKRINRSVPIKVMTEHEIHQHLSCLRAEHLNLIDAGKKALNGDTADLKEILTT